MKKEFLSNLFVEHGDTQPDTDLIYAKPISYPLKRILPFFFDAGKTILDVTAGRKKCWDTDLYSVESLIDGKPFCKVVFCDASPDSDADYIVDFRKLPFADNSFDIIFFDPPFTELKNSLEGHKGIKTRRSLKPTPAHCEFFFRGLKTWIPPEAYFFKLGKSLTVYLATVSLSKYLRDSKTLKRCLSSHTWTWHNKRFNHKSEFQRCANIAYRGRRMATGARTSNPQRVLSHYVVYKKNRRLR